jgi:hypothetical protein
MVSDDDASERISVSRKRVAAAIGPHVLAALAWAVVGHAGGAPGWSYDLTPLNPVCLRSSAGFVGSRLSAVEAASGDASNSANRRYVVFIVSSFGCGPVRFC